MDNLRIGLNTRLVPKSSGKPVSAKEISRIIPGAFVKIRFQVPFHGKTMGERMWVHVKTKTSSGGTGILDNDSVYSAKFKSGKRVTFKNSQVMDVLPPKGKVGAVQLWEGAGLAQLASVGRSSHEKNKTKGKKMSSHAQKKGRLHGAAAVQAARQGGYTIFLSGDAKNPRPRILSLADAEKWAKKEPARLFATPRGKRKASTSTGESAAKRSRAPRMPKAPKVRVNISVRGVVGFESMLQALAHTTDAQSLAKAWGYVLEAEQEGSINSHEYNRLRTVGTYLEAVFTKGAPPPGRAVPDDLKPYWKTHGHNIGASSEEGTAMTPKKKAAAKKKTSPKKKKGAAKKKVAPKKKKKAAAKKKTSVAGKKKAAPKKKKAAPKKKKAAPKKKKASPKKKKTTTVSGKKKAAPKKKKAAPKKKKAAPKKRAAKKTTVSITVGKKAAPKKKKKSSAKKKSHSGAHVLKLKKVGTHFVAIVKKDGKCYGRGYPHIISHSRVLEEFKANPSSFAPCKADVV